MAIRNNDVTLDHDSKLITGVDTDGNGEFTVSLTNLRRVRGLQDVSASASGGYVANPVASTENTVTVRLYSEAGAAGAMAPVAAGADVTDVVVEGRGW